MVTPYAENNSQDGLMFDIEAINTVTINQFSANLCDAGPYDMEIYYRAGTHFGFETTPGAWTLVGSTTGLVTNGPNVETVIPIAINIQIPAGQRYAFYVTESANTGNNMCYTNGNSPTPSNIATNVPVLADANIIVYEGTGKDYPFNTNFYPRMPNFSTDYDCCPPPILDISNNSCSGLPDGSIEATAQGTGPWIYEISDITGTFQTSGPTNGPFTFTDLLEGQYVVSSTDANGCTAIETAIVEPLDPIVIDPIVVDNLCYGGALGAVSVTVSGGTSPFNIGWADSFGNILFTDLQTNGTSTLSNLTAGSYLVGALDQAGCNAQISVDVEEPSVPLNLTLVSQQLSCFQSGDGTIEAMQDGLAPFIFELQDVTGNPIANGTSTGSFSFTDLNAGIYFVEVVDANGCETTDDVELLQPDLLEVETATTPVLCFNENQGTCQITSVSGGTTPYGQTTWNDPMQQVGNTATDLYAGAYVATVVDANGCELPVPFELLNPPPLTLTPSYMTDTCGQGLGAAVVTVSLGTPPYTYLWKPDSVDTQIHYDLFEGDYEVVVTDFNGCKDSVFVEVSDDIPYPFAAFDYRIEGEDPLTQEVQFLNNSIGTTQWTWNYGNGESEFGKNPRYHYDRAGDYLVQLISSNGFCEDTAYQYVNIDPLLVLYVPNAFTPGENGINDYFYPQGEGIEEESYDMFIFDRWGGLVWQTGNFSKKWNGTNLEGKDVPVGTYAWIIKFREYADLDRHVYKGVVTVIRE